MFDLLGGFVVKVLPASRLGALRSVLSEMAFHSITLNGEQLPDKQSLLDALAEKMEFGKLITGRVTGWDALSDLMWQRVMCVDGPEVTNLAFVIETGSALV